LTKLLRRTRQQLLKTNRIPPEQQLLPTPVVNLTAVLVVVPSAVASDSVADSFAVAVFCGGDRFLWLLQLHWVWLLLLFLLMQFVVIFIRGTT